MILWLSTPGFVKSGAMRAIAASELKRQGVKGQIMFNDLSIKTVELKSYNPKKMLDKHTLAKARKNLDNDIKILKPSLIVINDEAALRVVTGAKYALGTVRGSLYYYLGIPCIVLDLFANLRFRHTAKFTYELDISKICRWATGTQHDEPAFDYIVCKTVSEVAAEVKAAKSSDLVTTDRETAGGFITVTSYTYNTPDGRIRTFVVPFFDPWLEDGAYWREEKDEVQVWKLIGDLNASKVIKGFQNGTYDCAYDIMNGVPCYNYLIDTQNLMHSIWCEAPKGLHNIASYFCDHYTYWKDESKGIKEDGFGRDHSALDNYWRYNGLDSHYTWLGANALLKRIVALPWAMRNYNSEFSLSVGPCLAASLRGLKVSKQRHQQIMFEQSQKFEAGKADIRALSCEEDFNINSPADVAWLLYDVLGAKATRLQRKGGKLGPRSTDEKVLRLMKEQRNFFVSHAIDRILAAKKPGGVISKYGKWDELVYKNGRFLSWHNAAGTDTFRLNSGSCQFWTGTNGMNFQPFVQEIFVADKDYVFVDADFSASDDWFIAHEAEDEDKIVSLMTKDVHSYHASVFFHIAYEKIILGKKNHEDWVVHAITGVRQIAKKIAHGKNFRMQATMMYNLMGRDIAVEAARLAGYKNPERMTDKELIGMCDALCDLYDHPKKGMYKRIRAWQDESTAELKRNGNLATNAFGITRKFFGSADDHETQRQLSSYFGQSGTSGNANRALREIFYGEHNRALGAKAGGIDDGKTVLFLLQVHDSFKFLVHRSHLHKIAEIKRIMEKPVTVKGRTFFVPVAVECGLTDGKKMLPWYDGIKYEEIVAHEKKTYAEKFPEGNAALLKQLEGLNFLGEQLDQFEDQDNETSQQDSELELAETE